VIDLSGMEYVSSAGLRVFLVAARRLGTEGKLVLCCPTGHVRRVLDLVGFSSILGIYGRDEAIDRV
jgi:anti-anti-sigma factor